MLLLALDVAPQGVLEGPASHPDDRDGCLTDTKFRLIEVRLRGCLHYYQHYVFLNDKMWVIEDCM